MRLRYIGDNDENGLKTNEIYGVVISADYRDKIISVKTQPYDNVCDWTTYKYNTIYSFTKNWRDI